MSLVNELNEKISRLHQRLLKTQENLRNILDSINIWGNIPLYQRNETHPKRLLDIDNRAAKCKSRSMEAINSKELISFIMEENYRLFFNLPLLHPPPQPQPTGKVRLKTTILRQLDRRMDQQKRVAAPMVRRPRYSVSFSYSYVEVSFRQTEAIKDDDVIGTDDPAIIERSEESMKLYRPYEEYVDGLVSDAIMNAIRTRCSSQS